MKKIFQLINLAAILLCLNGCFSAPHKADEASAVDLSPYQGSQAKIAVNDFELKTSGLDAQVSSAMKEYFVNILESTKRFAIVAPQDADIIISVGIIEFVPENSGGKSGMAGGGSSASSFMGGLLGEVLNKANMQLSLRIIDRVSSEVVNSRDIQSQVVENPDKKTKFPQDKAFKEGLSDYAGTPMGKVIYDCLIEAGRFIVQNVPQKYYNSPRS
jgi:curli biogenesis system outer membrane secretion channel CsgG